MSVTSGFVSQTSEDINVTIAGAVRSLRCIRTDTAVNPGNSGGGLFNLEGELLGIVNAKITDEEIEGMANAICSNNVKNVIENIVYNFESQASETRTTVGVKKVYLGLTYTVCDQNNVFDEETSVNTTTNALLVGEVIKDSVADRMGLKSGDKVYGITVNGGATIYFDRVVDQIKDFILTLRVDDKVSLAIKTKDDSGNYGESCTASTTVTLLESDFKVSKDNARTKSSSSSATNTVDEVA